MLVLLPPTYMQRPQSMTGRTVSFLFLQTNPRVLAGYRVNLGWTWMVIRTLSLRTKRIFTPCSKFMSWHTKGWWPNRYYMMQALAKSYLGVSPTSYFLLFFSFLFLFLLFSFVFLILLPSFAKMKPTMKEQGNNEKEAWFRCRTFLKVEAEIIAASSNTSPSSSSISRSKVSSLEKA